MRAFVSLALILLVNSAVTTAHAQEVEDPWFGRDKALHFSASAVLAGGAYGGAAAMGASPEGRLLWGLGIGLGAGVAKETFDLVGDGDASWRDLTWDLAGVAVGIAAAWVIDWTMRAMVTHERVAR